jgi:hypothetical protein
MSVTVIQSNTPDVGLCHRQRQAVIAANTELQERELIKLASLASAMADTLRRRGVTDPAASLTAEAGIAVFKIAFQRWKNETYMTCSTNSPNWRSEHGRRTCCGSARRSFAKSVTTGWGGRGVEGGTDREEPL